MAIVKSIAEGHGGDVTVESELGKASCFTFALPLISESNQSAGETELIPAKFQMKEG